MTSGLRVVARYAGVMECTNRSLPNSAAENPAGGLWFTGKAALADADTERTAEYRGLKVRLLWYPESNDLAIPKMFEIKEDEIFVRLDMDGEEYRDDFFEFWNLTYFAAKFDVSFSVTEDKENPGRHYVDHFLIGRRFWRFGT
jgi:hypothetical protein